MPKLPYPAPCRSQAKLVPVKEKAASSTAEGIISFFIEYSYTQLR
jgi:hypothetical protein